MTKERIIANGEVGGFEIGGEDMGVLDGLDEYLVMGMIFPSPIFSSLLFSPCWKDLVLGERGALKS